MVGHQHGAGFFLTREEDHACRRVDHRLARQEKALRLFESLLRLRTGSTNSITTGSTAYARGQINRVSGEEVVLGQLPDRSDELHGPPLTCAADDTGG